LGTNSLQIIKRLKKVIGVDKIDDAAYNNADFANLRQSVLERAFYNATKDGGKFIPSKLVKELDDMFANNKEIMSELFRPDEIQTLKNWAGVVRNTLQPMELANLSNTASILSRTIQQAGRAAAGAAVLKSWGINAMLAARNAFDRVLDAVGQGRARRIVLSQISPEEFGKTFREAVTKPAGLKVPAGVGITQEAVGQRMVPVKAPQIQPVEVPSTGQQSAAPVLDRNMFSTLFPGDVLGSAISEKTRA
jgi:hypothetical protein